jgi:hypothetical protein
MITLHPTKRGFQFEGLVEFALGRIGDLRHFLLERTTNASPFVGDWRPSERRFWLRPDVTIQIRALPRRPNRYLRHATVLHVL